jgi:hypothetical protein
MKETGYIIRNQSTHYVTFSVVYWIWLFCRQRYPPFTGGASLALLPTAIGADLGMWAGGSAVNGTMNPFQWDYSDGKTWAGMGVGALAGGLGGGIGSGAIGGLSGMEAAVVGGMTAGAINGGGMTAIAPAACSVGEQ